jgi:hypothetical protein
VRESRQRGSVREASSNGRPYRENGHSPVSGPDCLAIIGVQPTLIVWHPGEGPLPTKPWSGKGWPT